MNNKKIDKHSRNNQINKTKSLNSIPINKLSMNLSSKTDKSKTINNNIIIYKNLISSNLQKHNIKKNNYDIMKINDLIDSKLTHFIATFKDYLINDYIDEFLNRFYKRNESKSCLSNFANYYINYFQFFSKPTFSNFFANKIITYYNQEKAEIFYNKNYGNIEKEKKKENNKEITKIIFNTLVKESIDYIINDTKDYTSTFDSQ